MREDLDRIDGKLVEAVALARALTWAPNPELTLLLIRALEETRGVITRLGEVMSAQEAA